MSEDEAITKWCPFARVVDDRRNLGPVYNRAFNGPADGANCIGSACMAWRWKTNRRVKVSNHMGEIEIDRIDLRDDYVQPVTIEDLPRQGRCGLAGETL